MIYQKFKASIRAQFPTMSSASIKKFYTWFSYHQNPTKDNMLVTEVPESVWINPWVKPDSNTSATHTHSYSEGYTPPNELKCIDCFVTNTGNSTVPEFWWEKPQEGINPMRYDANTASAVASISVPSDEQKKIDYLNNRAQNVFYNIERTFREMFHLHGPTQPRYYKELIDAIKNGDYEIDEKIAKNVDEAWEDFDSDEDRYFDYNVFYGINFTKFPQPDYKGRDVAYKELSAEFQRVKDIVAIMPAEEALAAVQAFEKWQPSNTPTKQ